MSNPQAGHGPDPTHGHVHTSGHPGGRDIMAQLIAGERDPRALPQLARRRARAKISWLEQALEGTEFFTGHHSALLEAMLRRTGLRDADIGKISAVTEELLAP